MSIKSIRIKKKSIFVLHKKNETDSMRKKKRFHHLAIVKFHHIAKKMAKSAIPFIHNSQECFAAGAQRNVRGSNACSWQKRNAQYTNCDVARERHVQSCRWNSVLENFITIFQPGFALCIAVNGHSRFHCNWLTQIQFDNCNYAIHFRLRTTEKVIRIASLIDAFYSTEECSHCFFVCFNICSSNIQFKSGAVLERSCFAYTPLCQQFDKNIHKTHYYCGVCSNRMENSVLYIGDAHDESLFTTLFTHRSAIIMWHNCSLNIITAWVEYCKFPTYVSHVSHVSHVFS